MALQHLLHVSHHGLVAEPEVQLQRGPPPGQLGGASPPQSWGPCPAPTGPDPYFFLQHVFPLLPHAPYQPGELGDPVSSLYLLHGRVEQRKGPRAAHPRAAVGRGA